jgi:hypothetical protein
MIPFAILVAHHFRSCQFCFGARLGSRGPDTAAPADRNRRSVDQHSDFYVIGLFLAPGSLKRLSNASWNVLYKASPVGYAMAVLMTYCAIAAIFEFEHRMNGKHALSSERQRVV